MGIALLANRRAAAVLALLGAAAWLSACPTISDPVPADDDDSAVSDDDDGTPADDDDSAVPDDDDSAVPDDDDAADDDDSAVPDDDDSAEVPDDPSAVALTVVVNRDDDVAPTPITQLYLDVIDSTVAGDEIVSLQKYFKNQGIIEALIAAVRRGVLVTAIYRDEVDPECDSLLGDGPAIDCAATFIEVADVHHKNLMVLKADGTVQAIVGSFNLRERSSNEPRVHTVLSFEVEPGSDVWSLYRGEADRLLSGIETGPMRVTLPAEDGGVLELTLHPDPANPPAELLAQVATCVAPVWLSYYVAFPDTVGTPVVDEVARLDAAGCEVRVLLQDDLLNNVMLGSMTLAGAEARTPDWTIDDDGLLGHKIVAVDDGTTAWLIQSSANLTVVDHQTTPHNLTVSVQGPSASPVYSAMQAAVRDELNRYW